MFAFLIACFISALDAENELLVQEALERLMQGKNFIFKIFVCAFFSVFFISSNIFPSFCI